MKMKYYMILIGVIFIGCDARQEANGFILDKETRKPLDSVAIGKGKKDDGNPFHVRMYSNKDGSFHYTSIGGSNDVELYFSKTEYKTIKIEYTSSHRPDTVYLENVFH